MKSNREDENQKYQTFSGCSYLLEAFKTVSFVLQLLLIVPCYEFKKFSFGSFPRFLWIFYVYETKEKKWGTGKRWINAVEHQLLIYDRTVSQPSTVSFISLKWCCGRIVMSHKQGRSHLCSLPTRRRRFGSLRTVATVDRDAVDNHVL